MFNHTQLQQFTNHIALVIDQSGSMRNKPVVEVFDRELERLKQRSVEMNQETRISIYLFDSTTTCIAFDMDVMRFKSIKGFYNPSGQTALIDATTKALMDHEKILTDYGDHAFLIYVLTDGGENASHSSDAKWLKDHIAKLPENWTIACLVPDSQGVAEAKRFGFPAESIDKWDVSSARGLEDAGRHTSNVFDNYMTMRSTGVRGTKSLFTLNSNGLTRKVASAMFEVVSPTEYKLFNVRKEVPIREFVESWTKSYTIGSAYYQPTKPVEIQAYKTILLQDVRNGKVYEGRHIRALLGLPSATVKVNPGDHADWRIFVQSTSVNRKLFPGTMVLVRG